MKLELIANTRKNSRGRHERFYTALDMAIIKHDASVKNAQRKRGDVVSHNNQHIFVCGCGREGCFIHTSYPSKERPVELKPAIESIVDSTARYNRRMP